jgi:hypothetical protein
MKNRNGHESRQNYQKAGKAGCEKFCKQGMTIVFAA